MKEGIFLPAEHSTFVAQSSEQKNPLDKHPILSERINKRTGKSGLHSDVERDILTLSPIAQLLDRNPWVRALSQGTMGAATIITPPVANHLFTHNEQASSNYDSATQVSYNIKIETSQNTSVTEPLVVENTSYKVPGLASPAIDQDYLFDPSTSNSTDSNKETKLEIRPPNSKNTKNNEPVLTASSVMGETLASPIALDAESQYFKETNRVVGGPFLEAWQNKGGLAQFGLPLSAAFQEVSTTDGKAYIVQYFERVKMEIHPENEGTEFHVMFGLIGTETFNGRYKEKGDHPARQPEQKTTDPNVVSINNHNVSGSFLEYFKAHGGINQQGLPISAVMDEVTADGKVHKVQYFQRSKFEENFDKDGKPMIELERAGAGAAKLKYPLGFDRENGLPIIATEKPTEKPADPTKVPTPEAQKEEIKFVESVKDGKGIEVGISESMETIDFSDISSNKEKVDQAGGYGILSAVEAVVDQQKGQFLEGGRFTFTFPIKIDNGLTGYGTTFGKGETLIVDKIVFKAGVPTGDSARVGISGLSISLYPEKIGDKVYMVIGRDNANFGDWYDVAMLAAGAGNMFVVAAEVADGGTMQYGDIAKDGRILTKEQAKIMNPIIDTDYTSLVPRNK